MTDEAPRETWARTSPAPGRSAVKGPVDEIVPTPPSALQETPTDPTSVLPLKARVANVACSPTPRLTKAGRTSQRSKVGSVAVTATSVLAECPALSKTVTTTWYVPKSANVCWGAASEEALRSPKSQDHVYGGEPPSADAANETSSGMAPNAGLTVASTTRGGATSTVTFRMVSFPSGSRIVSRAV